MSRWLLHHQPVHVTVSYFNYKLVHKPHEYYSYKFHKPSLTIMWLFFKVDAWHFWVSTAGLDSWMHLQFQWFLGVWMKKGPWTHSCSSFVPPSDIHWYSTSYAYAMWNHRDHEYILVGGLEHGCFMTFHKKLGMNHDPNWRFVHQFSEGWRKTTNQPSCADLEVVFGNVKPH